MRVIFLDIDGVLNTLHNQGRIGPDHIQPELAARLEKLVQSTQAKIVVSSSWRHILTPEHLGRFLAARGAPTAAQSIIDRTPIGMKGRGLEIQDWLDLESERKIVHGPQYDPIESFVILDDSGDMTSEQQPHFVQTNGQFGLTDQDVARAITILRMSP